MSERKENWRVRISFSLLFRAGVTFLSDCVPYGFVPFCAPLLPLRQLVHAHVTAGRTSEQSRGRKGKLVRAQQMSHFCSGLVSLKGSFRHQPRNKESHRIFCWLSLDIIKSVVFYFKGTALENWTLWKQPTLKFSRAGKGSDYSIQTFPPHANRHHLAKFSYITIVFLDHSKSSSKALSFILTNAGRTMIMGVEGSFPPGLDFSLWQFVAEKYSNTPWMFLCLKTFGELLIPGFYPAAFWIHINSQDPQRIPQVSQEIYEEM